MRLRRTLWSMNCPLVEWVTGTTPPLRQVPCSARGRRRGFWGIFLHRPRGLKFDSRVSLFLHGIHAALDKWPSWKIPPLFSSMGFLSAAHPIDQGEDSIFSVVGGECFRIVFWGVKRQNFSKFVGQSHFLIVHWYANFSNYIPRRRSVKGSLSCLSNTRTTVRTPEPS